MSMRFNDYDVVSCTPQEKETALHKELTLWVIAGWVKDTTAIEAINNFCVEQEIEATVLFQGDYSTQETFPLVEE